MQTKLGVRVRWMIRRDMAEVCAIEKQCFEFPWSEDDFIRRLRQRNCIGVVAEHGGDHDKRVVVGYMLYELHQTFLHLLNLGVDPLFRRRGFGSAMLEKLAGKLSPTKRVRILTEVSERNLGAQLWLRANGFRAMKILKNHYDRGDHEEDAISFERRV